MMIDPPMIEEIEPPTPIKVETIKKERLDWEKIENNKITTKELTVHLEDGMKTIEGTTSKALEFDGLSHFATITPKGDNCLADITHCEKSGKLV